MGNVNYMDNNTMDIKFDLLSLEHLKNLKVFENISYYSKPTDFAMKLGCKVSYKYDREGTGKYFLKDSMPTCCSIVKSRFGIDYFAEISKRYVVFEDGRQDLVCLIGIDNEYGIRPVFDFGNNYEMFEHMKRQKNGVLVGEYGEYPQSLMPIGDVITLLVNTIFHESSYTNKYYELYEYKKEIESYVVPFFY